MAELVTITIVLVATIAWAFSRTEYARRRLWRQFGVQLLVCVYGFGLVVLGHSVADILGNIALLPGSLIIWIPFVELVLTIVFWPFLGHLLASSHLATKRFWFCAIILMQYAGVLLVVLIRNDSLSVAWKYNPIGFPLFWIVYALGQVAMWGCLINQMRLNSR